MSSLKKCFALAVVLLVSSVGHRCALYAQQVVQRGAFGVPSQVMDETQQWTTPLLLSSDRDVQIYIPDVTAPAWLQRNYATFRANGTYTLTMFTFYKTPAACRINQTGWGLGDAAHLNACVMIGFRLRRALVDPQQKSVTLLSAGMLDKNGAVDPGTIQEQHVFRTWDQLDANTTSALRRANGLVQEQMAIYDRQMQSVR